MNKEQFERLVREGYDANILFLLELTREERESFESSKIKAWMQGGIRRHLLTEELEITVAGKELLSQYNGTMAVPAVKKEDIGEKFEQWWQVFPSSDYFSHKGKTFEGSRAMKVNKTAGSPSDSFTNFKRIINEGLYTADDIIRATEFHISTAKDLSIKKNENKLSFIPASERYLRIKAFAPYVELSKQKPVKEQSNTFEI